MAIEISHDGHVNRTDIVRDFVVRSLPPPLDIIHGDCLCPKVRQQARLAIGGDSFDIIITDPPYGIREAMSSSTLLSSSSVSSSGVEEEIEEGDEKIVPPLTQLFFAMGHD